MIEALIHRIKIRQAELKESMSVGTPTTFEAYQRMVGHCQGLQDVMTMIDNMLEEEKTDKNQ